MQRSHRRSTKVCLRCRKRKTKCDFKFPACTSCKLANVACVGFDPTTREAVPRSLVRSLEARVAALEAQTLAFRAAPQNVPGSMAAVIGRATLSAGIPSSMSYLRSRISSGRLFQPSCPPLAVARDPVYGAGDTGGNLAMAAAAQERRRPLSSRSRGGHAGAATAATATTAATASRYSANTIIDLDSIPLSAIERIVANYVDTHLPQYPCISQAMLEDIVARAVRNRGRDAGGGKASRRATATATAATTATTTTTTSTTTTPAPTSTGGLPPNHFEYFVLFITLAISTMTLTWKDDDQARRASESFCNSALTHLQQVDVAGDMAALQISLLLAHYAHMCPERVDNWTCIASAVAIVLRLGLFRRSPATLPAAQARQRAELFWVTYGMERSLCSNVRLPLSFPEEVVTVREGGEGEGEEAFLDDKDRIKRASASQIRKYRALEAEVHRVLHLDEDLARVAGGRVRSIEGWLADVGERMARWRAEAQRFTQHNMLEFKQIQYHHLRARIHRPTPRLRTRSTADRAIVLAAARLLIDDYRQQARRRRLFYPWHGAHILFEVALIALEACWTEARGAGAGGPPDAEAAAERRQMLAVHLPHCLQILDHIGERWRGAAACADRLRPLVDKVRTVLGGTTETAAETTTTTTVTPVFDSAITEEIQGLLFSDRPLVWHQESPGDMSDAAALLFGLEENPFPGGGGGNGGGSGGDGGFPLVEDLELFQWDPDWSILPEMGGMV